MQLIADWFIRTVSVVVTALILPGVHINNMLTALAVAVVLSLINTLLKPILIILTLPITIITLGLFTLIINSVLVLLTSAIVPGFTVDGIWWALLFSLILSLINSVLFRTIRENN